MATLLGESAEQATNVSASGKEIAGQFECTIAGILEELHVIPNKTWTLGGATKVFLGIAEENAGVPGTVMASKESAEVPKEKIAFALAGFSVALTLGTKYWLIAKSGNTTGLASVAGKTAGASTVRKSTKTVAKIETLTEWEAAEAKGPLSFWGTGTESGGGALQVAGVAKIKLFGSAAPEQAQAVAGVSRVRIQTSAALLQTLAAGGTARVTLKDTAALQQALSMAGVSTVRVQTAGQAGQIMGVAGVAQVRFKGTANVKLAETGGRKIAIFIYEE